MYFFYKFNLDAEVPFSETSGILSVLSDFNYTFPSPIPLKWQLHF